MNSGQSSSNVVDLIGHYGGDDTHALSAWTSTHRDVDEGRRERLPALLAGLAKNGHHTPFEKSYLHFLLRCDNATHVHLLKHRIGVSINGESARYKELRQASAYIPPDWPEDLRVELSEFYDEAQARYQSALATLEPTHGRTRAKESARYFLPYANQLTFDVAFNFRSFMHFVGLRCAPDAQLEIRHLAEQMLALVAATGEFDASLEAFGVA